GNHRVLRIPASRLNSDKTPEADIVLGQADFASGSSNRGKTVGADTLNAPTALAFDAQGALYIADFTNARVVKYPTPTAANTVAGAVFGQPNLTSRGVPALATDSSMAGPMGITVTPDGSLHVAVPLNHRILVFDSGVSASSAKSVLGQNNLTAV